MSEDLVERAKALIQKALDANAEERARLESSLGHLRGDSISRQSRRPRKPARQRVRPGERQKQVLAELNKGPGKPSELARRAGIASTSIYPVLKSLLKDKEVTEDGGIYTRVPERRRRRRSK